MTARLQIAITADLHWGLSQVGDAAVRNLAESLAAHPTDLLILAGDLGTREHFAECLTLFDPLSCRKVLVPGNHDLWVEPADPRGDSLELYDRLLPAIAAEHGFHYLDHAPLMLPEHGLAVVGGINWYDYSWSIRQLPLAAPDWESRLLEKRFTRGRHNDANFIRWPTNDIRFTERFLVRFQEHLTLALAASGRAIVVTHHPCFRGLNFPRKDPPTLDGLLWDAFSGNADLERLLEAHQSRIAFAFCGHTHQAREANLGTIRGYNLGGDYDFKRLLRLDWPGGEVAAEEFRAPGTE